MWYLHCKHNIMRKQHSMQLNQFSLSQNSEWCTDYFPLYITENSDIKQWVPDSHANVYDPLLQTSPNKCNSRISLSLLTLVHYTFLALTHSELFYVLKKMLVLSYGICQGNDKLASKCYFLTIVSLAILSPHRLFETCSLQMCWN